MASVTAGQTLNAQGKVNKCKLIEDVIGEELAKLKGDESKLDYKRIKTIANLRLESFPKSQRPSPIDNSNMNQTKAVLRQRGLLTLKGKFPCGSKPVEYKLPTEEIIVSCPAFTVEELIAVREFLDEIGHDVNKANELINAVTQLFYSR